MTKQQQGGCHCGAVRYTLSSEPEATFYCHCQDCQRTSGSPFSMELMVKEDAFECSGSLESYEVTGDSGKSVKRWFCPKCASGIYIECEADPGYVFLKVGSLDDSSWITPEMHIFTASKTSWTTISDQLPQFEKMPPT